MDNHVDFRVHLGKVNELITEEKYIEALSLASNLMKYQPPIGIVVDLHWAHAKAYTGIGDWQLAEISWTRVLDFLPENPEVYEGRSAARALAGDTQGAEADRVRAIALREKLKQILRKTAANPVWDRVADLYTHDIKQRKQSNHFVVPGDAGVRSNGRIADWNRIEVACTRAIARNPANPMAYYRRAFVRYSKKNWAAAVADCDRAVELNHHFADAYNLRASAYDKSGDLEKAIADWTRVLELTPGDVRVYALRGFAHEELGNETLAAADRLRTYELSKPS